MYGSKASNEYGRSGNEYVIGFPFAKSNGMLEKNGVLVFLCHLLFVTGHAGIIIRPRHPPGNPLDRAQVSGVIV